MTFVLAVLLASAIQVRVTTVDGDASEAKLLQVTGAGVEIESRSETKTIPFDNLLSINRVDPPATSAPTMRVQLNNGSRIAISSILADGNQATFTLRDQKPLIVPIKQLRWLRFRPSSPTSDPQWLGMVEKPRTTDVLVVRRSGDALDEVEGIVKSISATTVTFDLDGEDLPAPIERLEGILFANSTEPMSLGNIVVDDATGSRWQAVSVGPGKQDSIMLQLSDGLSHEITLNQILKLETTGSVLFLASEEPASGRFNSTSKIGLNDDLANRWFGTSSDDGRDLVMRADSTIEYRLDGQYATLVGSVDFDSSVTAGGQCEVVVSLDDNAVWSQTFDVKAGSVKGFELPVGTAKRVRFAVTSAGDGDLGDTLRFRQPRLVK